MASRATKTHILLPPSSKGCRRVADRPSFTEPMHVYESTEQEFAEKILTRTSNVHAATRSSLFDGTEPRRRIVGRCRCVDIPKHTFSSFPFGILPSFSLGLGTSSLFFLRRKETL